MALSGPDFGTPREKRDVWMWASLKQRRTIERKTMRREKMQNTSAQPSGWNNTPAPGTASQESTKEEPLKVTQEAIEAYERRTGFYGIGRIMVEDGHWIIVTPEELARSRAQVHANRHPVTRQRGVA